MWFLNQPRVNFLKVYKNYYMIILWYKICNELIFSRGQKWET